MRHDEQTLRMLKRISRERDFIPFLVQRALINANDSLTQEGPAMYRTQGAALALRELADLIEKAASLP